MTKIMWQITGNKYHVTGIRQQVQGNEYNITSENGKWHLNDKWAGYWLISLQWASYQAWWGFNPNNPMTKDYGPFTPKL